MIKLLIISVAVMATLTGVGLLQDYLNNPVLGCTKFDTGVSYDTGYHCKSGDVYMLN